MPFEEGEKFLLSKGYNGSFLRTNENSLDFTMLESTMITVARGDRGGKVADLKENSNWLSECIM